MRRIPLLRKWSAHRLEEPEDLVRFQGVGLCPGSPTAEAVGSNSAQCEFESHPGHRDSIRRAYWRAPPTWWESLRGLQVRILSLSRNNLK